jgi:hypothetical protein
MTGLALLLWQGVAAGLDHTDERADRPRRRLGWPSLRRGRVVGYVTVEFDATGVPHSDGRFYTDLGDAADVASRRNEAEHEPADLLDRWWVLPVIARDRGAAAAAAQAAHLQTQSSRDRNRKANP